MYRELVTARLSLDNFAVQWGVDEGGQCEMVGLYLARESLLEVIQKGAARRDEARHELIGALKAEAERQRVEQIRFLDVLKKGAARRRVERWRLLDVMKKGAKRVRSYDTADDLAGFLFGGNLL
jgi:hypothetical protein